MGRITQRVRSAVLMMGVALSALAAPEAVRAQAPPFECGFDAEPGADARSFAEAYLNAWNSRDEIALRTFFAKSVVYRDATANIHLDGIDAVLAHLQRQVSVSPDLRWTLTDVICESPSRIALRWLSARTINGQRIEVEGVSILNLVAGRVVTGTDFSAACGVPAAGR